MLEERKKAFDNISRIFAITRYDIEHHQAINDLSLNIHGENYFRDVFNFLYNANFVNPNADKKNTAFIDLVDTKSKKAYQITTTRKKTKIENSLKSLKKPEFKDYEILIYYLLEKPNPPKKTEDDLQKRFGVNIRECIKDYTDIIRAVENLETEKIIEFNRRFCKGKEEKYTDEIILDLVIKHLISQKKKIQRDYDDDFGTIETDKKLLLNNLNNRIAAKINEGLDYRIIIETLEKDDNTLSDLRELIINEYYKDILIEVLASKVSTSNQKIYEIPELHLLAKNNDMDFNKIINKLHHKIESSIEIQDFNSMNIGWIIIAFFFEICDIGCYQE
jgi:hypothetical protein